MTSRARTPERVRPLNRFTHPAPVLPVGVVHLGLGAFHRAHQAYYTELANREAREGGGAACGIAAFTGRRPDAARVLQSQDGLYTLVTRDADGDRTEVISSISQAYSGADLDSLLRLMADPGVGVVTLTVTEKGYRTRAGEDGVAIKLLAGLAARRRAGGTPLALVSCDNLSANGDVLRSAVTEVGRRLVAEGTQPVHGVSITQDTLTWIETEISFVSTMVDRITPATRESDVEELESMTGFADACPVITEPFHEWVLEGEFPAGRPAWEAGGARFVDDVSAHERRKLWLLNGTHSALAYDGLEHGSTTVAQAFSTPRGEHLVRALWAEAAEVLGFPAAEITGYCQQLARRYRNPRIRHELRQIAQDGSQKLSQRIVAPLRARLTAGLEPGAAQIAVLAAWGQHLRRGEHVGDPHAPHIARDASNDDVAHAVLAAVAADLVGSPVEQEVRDRLADYRG